MAKPAPKMPDFPPAAATEPSATEILLADLRRSRRQLQRNTEQLERIKREDAEPAKPSNR